MSIRAKFDLMRDEFRLEVDLTLPSQGVTVLFGPSGSGKTSVLRCMAGFEPSARGVFQIGDQYFQDDARQINLPTYQRDIGIVFQEASLFDHLNVRRNLEYGRSRVPAAQQRIGLTQITQLLGIAHLLERDARSLSGGERQRVAIARALLTSPSILLMDEPLSALDYKRKREILPYLEELHRELDIPIIYVTHSIDEVVRLADHIVLLDEGRAAACGPLSETLARMDLPPTFVEEAGAILEGVVTEHDARHSMVSLATEAGMFWVPAAALKLGQTARVRIHARDVSLALSRQTDTSILNVLPATVQSFTSANQAGHLLVECRSGSANIIARITSRSFDALQIAPGQQVWLQVKSVSLVQ